MSAWTFTGLKDSWAITTQAYATYPTLIKHINT